MPDIEIWEADLMWLRSRAKARGYSADDEDLQDNFCERVGIMCANGLPEGIAREQAFICCFPDWEEKSKHGKF